MKKFTMIIAVVGLVVISSRDYSSRPDIAQRDSQVKTEQMVDWYCRGRAFDQPEIAEVLIVTESRSYVWMDVLLVNGKVKSYEFRANRVNELKLKSESPYFELAIDSSFGENEIHTASLHFSLDAKDALQGKSISIDKDEFRCNALDVVTGSLTKHLAQN